MSSTMSLIQSFLAQKRFAMIGVSRDPKDFSALLCAEFENRGYAVVPVNPAAASLFELKTYARVQDITPPVHAALVMTPRRLDLDILRDCAEASIRLVWLYGISGDKEISRPAKDFCASNGIDLIAGYCPYMVLPKAAFFHRVHGAIARVIGMYPH